MYIVQCVLIKVDHYTAERFGLRPSKVERSTRPKDTHLTVGKGIISFYRFAVQFVLPVELLLRLCYVLEWTLFHFYRYPAK